MPLALLKHDVDTFSTDSRRVKAGDLFFAFSQPEFGKNGFNGDFMDAHKFIPSAFEKGAIACVARRDRFKKHEAFLESFQDRLIFTKDVIMAFQKLAHEVYLNWNKPVVAVTGSAGKTTAKELIAHVLSKSGRKVLYNAENLNNGLGHPITVLKLVKEDNFDVAVLEMGMSTPMNEIKRLCDITPPDFGVELNVLPIHVEYLGSIENVAKAKAELIEGLKKGGTAILNADDFRVAKMKNLHRGKTFTYGIDNDADIMALGIEVKRFGKTRFTLKTPGGNKDVVFQLPGKHNILNALAASAVGHGFGMTASEIAIALSSAKPAAQRGEVLDFAAGFTVVNDTYNSNPDALLRMVKTLSEGAKSSARKVVVAGEMLELGADEKKLHTDTGKLIAKSGADLLIGIRGLAREMIEAASGKDLKTALFFESSEEAGDFLVKEVKKDDVILVKGSRGVQTEKIIEKLLENFQLIK